MSTIQTFSRLALKQFCALLEGAAEEKGTPLAAGDLEGALWTKMTAGNPAAESIRIPYPLLKKTLRKLKIELPYMPSIINYNIGCSALKVSGGLYLPCCGVCEEESAYCGVCSKQEVKYGVMEDRGDVGTYSDPFDKHEISYGTWLAKTEKTLDEVYEALQSEGFELVIPSHYLTVNSKRVVKEVKARKGRPKAAKKEMTGDSDSGSASEAEEKPKKSKKSKKSSSTDLELFETVVDGISTEESPAKAKKPKAEKSKKTKSPKGSDADSDEEKVKKPKAEKSKKTKSPKGSDADEEKPAKSKKPKADKPKSPKGSDADEEKAVKVKKPKAEKPKKAKGSDSDSDGEKVEKKPKSEKSKTEKKEKKAKSPKAENSTDMSARFGAELTVENYVPSGFDARVESFGENTEETVWVDEVAYILRGKLLFDTETGEKVGEMNANGVGVIDPEDEF